MGKGIERLTAREVDAKKAPGVYADGGGLYLRVAPGGTKAWMFRYMLAGTAHNMGLGPIHTVSLAEARERARQQRLAKLDGHDPIMQRRATVAANLGALPVPTFGKLAEEYITAKEREWTDRRLGNDWRAALGLSKVKPGRKPPKAYAQSLLAMPVDKIGLPDVLKVLTPLAPTRYKLMLKVQSYLAAVLAYAKSQGHRTGDNPATWKGNLQHAGLTASDSVKEVVGRKALPFAELPALIAELQGEDIKGKALEFLILTASRIGEVAFGDRNPGMKWSEVNFDTATWIIPKERMKMKVEHRVPLSDRAVAILREMETLRTDDRVFPIGNWAVRRHLKALRPDIDVHGFRSTFRGWARVNKIGDKEAEYALAHRKGSKTEKAYDREDLLEERRLVMQRWARYCAGETVDAKVVQLRGSRV